MPTLDRSRALLFSIGAFVTALCLLVGLGHWSLVGAVSLGVAKEARLRYYGYHWSWVRAAWVSAGALTVYLPALHAAIQGV